VTADETEPAGTEPVGDASGAAGEGGEGFEAALERLEGIVRRLDREELELDEALELFEKGVGDLRTATRQLDAARGKVEELIEDAAGELETVDFDLPTDDAAGD
jgi:exodeoxyribonuclease VII small subunit